ncbi:MAG: hypothetical protein KDI35_16880, partial [Gammaproteobacteria bacterium]|nr:hypothetical protein [Gammaproteobacteria bacterium]
MQRIRGVDQIGFGTSPSLTSGSCRDFADSGWLKRRLSLPGGTGAATGTAKKMARGEARLRSERRDRLLRYPQAVQQKAHRRFIVEVVEVV